MERDADGRDPTAEERRMFDALLSAEFRGRNDLLIQLNNCRVKVIDEDNVSIQLLVSRDLKEVDSEQRVISEATWDENGVTVHALLHVVGGYADVLEIFREDLLPVTRPMPEHGVTAFAGP